MNFTIEMKKALMGRAKGFKVLLEDIAVILNESEEAENSIWKNFSEMLEYIMPDHPYANTFFLVPVIYKLISGENDGPNCEMATELGWCYQMFQALHLMADDWVDDGDMRYGKASWNRLQQKEGRHGHFNVLEILILQGVIMKLIRKKCEHLDKSTYLEILHAFNDSSLSWSEGNTLETKIKVDTLDMTDTENLMTRYRNIVDLKTSPINFFLPTSLAMTLGIIAKEGRQEVFDKVNAVTKEIGYYCQVFDDYYDCFSGTGKQVDTKNSDIRRGQFTWLLVKALVKCDRTKKAQLFSHYGKPNDASIEIVKNIFETCNLHQEFIDFKIKQYDVCIRSINENLKNEEGIKIALMEYLNFVRKTFTG